MNTAWLQNRVVVCITWSLILEGQDVASLFKPLQLWAGEWISQTSRTGQMLRSCPDTYLMELITLSSLPRGGCKKQPFVISQMSNNTIPQILLLSLVQCTTLFVTISAIYVLLNPFGGACEIFMNIKKNVEDIFCNQHNMICTVEAYLFH